MNLYQFIKRGVAAVMAATLLFTNVANVQASEENIAYEQLDETISENNFIQSVEEETEEAFETVSSNMEKKAEEAIPVNAKLLQEGELNVIVERGGEIPSYSVLSDDSEEVPYAEAKEYFYQELKKEATTIDLSRFKIDKEDFNYFFNWVLNDHGDLYKVHAETARYSYALSDNCVTRVTIGYYADRDSALFEQAVEDALLVIEPGMTDLEKAIALHDYIILNTAYDYDSLLANNVPKVSYSAYGVLVNGVAVCNGYALAYKYLCELQGIECLMVTSDSMNHAWNLIKLGDHYYHVDATWDDPTRDLLGRVRHFYMFSSDASFQQDKEHYGWQVMKNASMADIKATDTTYDNYYWLTINSQMIYGEKDYYYVDSANFQLKKISRSTLESEVLGRLGYWKSWTTGGYWTMGYASLFEANDRLYYNESNGIYSIDPENPSDVKLEYSNPHSTTGEIYGMALQKGVVKYVVGQNPNRIQDFTTHIAEFEEDIVLPAEKVVLSQKEAELATNGQLTLNYTLYPSYVTPNQVTWESDNLAVATVTNGVVTAVGEGSCNIIVTVDGVSDGCHITVSGATKQPRFSIPAGTIDKGQSVTITAEENAKIYYSLNNTDPVLQGQLYQSPIVINEDVTINAYAVVEGQERSQVVSVSYIACENQLVFSQTSLTLKQGESLTLSFSKLPTTKTTADVTITSNNTNVAVVENGTMVRGAGKGQATLTARVADHKGRTVTAQITVTVTSITYTVKFWNGNQLLSEGQVEKGAAAVPPAAPDKLGYSFIGWDKSYDNIQADTELYAQYSPIIYQIDYQTGEGSNDSANPSQYTIESDTITLQPAMPPEGYRFVGWYQESSYKTQISTITKGSTGNLTLYAKWSDERGLWIEDIAPLAYTGKKVQPSEIKVSDGNTLLKEGVDYTVSYKNNINANDLSPEKIGKAPTITIKGKGNYKGTVTKNFEILTKSLEDSDVMIDDLVLSYKAGKKQLPVPKISWNGKNLSKNKDFILTYVNNEDSDAFNEPGEYLIEVEGINNYSGKRTIKLQIATKEEILISRAKVKKIPNVEYTGEEIAVEELLQLTYNNLPLTIGEDYTLTYEPCIQVGTHIIKVEGMGSFKGTLRTSFKITGRSMSKVKVEGLPASVVYTGKDLVLGDDGFVWTPKLTFSSKEAGIITLQEEHYEVSYQNNKNRGTAQIIFTGKNGYSGTLKKTVKIGAYDLKADPDNKVDIILAEDPIYYNKNGAKPSLSVIFDGKPLTENKDYKITYKNNKAISPFVGESPATAVISGIGNFTNKVEIRFTIERQRMEELAVYAPGVEAGGPGKYVSKIKVYDISGKTLTEGKDYFVLYKDKEGNSLDKKSQIAEGKTVVAEIFGKGNYEGMATTEYQILGKGKDIAKAKVTLEKGKKWYYTGEQVILNKEDFKVKIGKLVLLPEDYEIISYSNNISKGTAKAVIEGKGSFGGRKEFTFKIESQSMKWWEKR
ncbi:MAG: chitobiase/beta-hexosaminidase C-terminal domain-containing protein [Lachnospiraceae bacterium]|nr:chitobiase/beta-hexosaminidase C-terminal domain-containing protein [Lachnospiraceae bacterium]